MDRRRAGNTPTQADTNTQVQAGYHACTTAQPLLEVGGDNRLNTRQLLTITSEPPHSEHTPNIAAAAGVTRGHVKFSLLYKSVIKESNNIFYIFKMSKSSQSLNLGSMNDQTLLGAGFKRLKSKLIVTDCI